jgi:hypothetical protein
MPNGYCERGLSHGRLHDFSQAPRIILEPTMIFYQILKNVIFQRLSDRVRKMETSLFIVAVISQCLGEGSECPSTCNGPKKISWQSELKTKY